MARPPQDGPQPTPSSILMPPSPAFASLLLEPLVIKDALQLVNTATAARLPVTFPVEDSTMAERRSHVATADRRSACRWPSAASNATRRAVAAATPASIAAMFTVVVWQGS